MILYVLTGNQVACEVCFKRVWVCTNNFMVVFSSCPSAVYFSGSLNPLHRRKKKVGGFVCVKKAFDFCWGQLCFVLFSSFLQLSSVIFKLLFAIWKLGINKMLFCLLHQSIPLSLQADSGRGCLSFQKYASNVHTLMMQKTCAVPLASQGWCGAAIPTETRTAGPFLIQFCSLTFIWEKQNFLNITLSANNYDSQQHASSSLAACSYISNLAQHLTRHLLNLTKIQTLR